MYVDEYEMGRMSSYSWEWVPRLVFLGLDEGGETIYMGFTKWRLWWAMINDDSFNWKIYTYLHTIKIAQESDGYGQ